MLDQIEGSQAVALAVARCRPQVVCAYPITPQTHIVEAIGVMAQEGGLGSCRFMNVESEFGAMSVCIGASAAGSRTYTATASQGLLYMAEAVYNASGLGLPIVMTVANRAVGAPINIWNDHGDAMALRDSGWIQLYAADNQEAVDLHIQAFRLAELASIPVMVCVDGFVLTHAVEEIDVPGPDEIDAFLPPFQPRQRLDPDAPITIGAMVGPEAFTEVRYLDRHRLLGSLDAIPTIGSEFSRRFGRPGAAFLRPYRVEDAETVVVVQGSVFGTLCDVVDDLRGEAMSVGALAVTTYRPFPLDAARSALARATRVIVVDRAVGPGRGYLATDVAPAVTRGASLRSVIAGLGGRPVTKDALTRCIRNPGTSPGEQPEFLDLDLAIVSAQGEGAR